MTTQQVQQGWSQMTAAAQQIIRQGLGVMRSTGRRTRSASRSRRSKAAAGRKSKKRATASSRRSKSSRLIKGSAAAKAWGRKMKRLRAKG